MNMQRLITTCTAIGISAALGTWLFLTQVYPAFADQRKQREIPHIEIKPVFSKPKLVETVTPVVETQPQVEVVFVLDTTGSMGGLIEGAKKKIWEMARFIAQGQPAPKLKIGLIGYRDIGDSYVTKIFDLSGDLDEVYQHLSAFRAEGGGDTPEHVAKALSDAIFKTSWSSSKNTLKIVYVVGDAPPHTDYQDGYDYLKITKQAKERGIKVNTIRCGTDDETRRYFTEIAQLSGGEYASIEQSGGMADISTPYDTELAELNSKLTGTTLAYGSAVQQQVTHSKLRINMDAAPAVQAERASVYGMMNKSAGRVAATGEGDLLDDVVNKKVDIAKLSKDHLPESMKNMPADERAAFLAQKQKERQGILSKISELSTQRDSYLKTQKPVAGSFDEKVRGSLKKQAHAAGLKL